MALQSDAIESRLEGLKLDDRRMMFDSKLRAFRIESKPPTTSGDRATDPPRRLESEKPDERVIALLEELSVRIDGLEKKNRHLGDELRQRTRQERRWRSAVATVVLAAAGIWALRWVMHWI